MHQKDASSKNNDGCERNIYLKYKVNPAFYKDFFFSIWVLKLD